MRRKLLTVCTMLWEDLILRVGGRAFTNRGCFFDNVSEGVMEKYCSVGMEVMSVGKKSELSIFL
ncbi:hypothetical protein J2X83_003108 [Brevibacillus nitrificans]|nr:hypothetical protein [Brevibacillus nitrificans]